MNFAERPKSSALVLGLFMLLVFLQVADVHSTLTAPSHRAEANPFIVWIAARYGLVTALVLIKVFCISVIAFMFRLWQNSKGTYNAHLAAATGLLTLEYLLVVYNNYSH